MLTPVTHGDDEFIRRFTMVQSDLRAFIVGMSPSRSDVDDILQEVNLALWHKREAYDSSRDFLRWALGFAVTQVRRYRVKCARNRLWFNEDVLESLAESWSMTSQNSEERRDALVACLDKLGPIERQYIAQYYGRQRTAQKLAEEKGRPVSTVYKVLSRARERLRDCVTRSLTLADQGL